MKRARKAKRVARKPAAPIAMLVAINRLERAVAVLSCLAFAADAGAELDFAPVALAARDLLDGVLTDLAPLRGPGVRP